MLDKKNKTIVCIDLGTNSMLALGMQVEKNNYQKIFDHYYMPRLGEGFIHTQTISEQAIQRTLIALNDCKNKLLDFAQDPQVFITASSAIRESKNKKEVLAQLNQVFSNRIEIISGDEEARLSYRSMLDCYQKNTHNMVFDIGGGSTEIIQGNENHLISAHSYRFGTIKLLDLFFKSSVNAHLIEQAKKFVFDFLDAFDPKKEALQFYGTAGSFTQTVSLLGQIPTYSPEHIDGTDITPASIHACIEKLQFLSVQEIQMLVGVDPQRADVILPGLIIIACLMEHFQIPRIKVFDRGVRYGKFFDVFYASSG